MAADFEIFNLICTDASIVSPRKAVTIEVVPVYRVYMQSCETNQFIALMVIITNHT